MLIYNIYLGFKEVTKMTKLLEIKDKMQAISFVKIPRVL